MYDYSGALSIGTSLQPNSKYLIKEVLGQGGFGITYLAWFSNLQRTVAIKEFFPARLCYREGNQVQAEPIYQQYFEKFRTQFLDEAKQLAQFKHGNIVAITDFFSENNTAYFVMHYLDGITLHDLVKRNGVLDEKQAIDIIKQIGGAVELINEKQIIHRDIKPKNIIIDSIGKATLIDFGAAREIVETNIEHTAIFSDGFASPEQYNKTGKKGPHIDVYGLGATMYYCLTGQVPISARLRESTELASPIELNPNISKELDQIVMTALEMDLDKRYKNVSKLVYHLSTIKPSQLHHKNFGLNDSQREALKNVEVFLSDNDAKAFILTGYVSSGKTKLIQKIVESIQKRDLNYRLLTFGSRLAQRKVLS